MANPLLSQFGNNNFVSQFMNEFQRLQKTIANPQQEVERLLKSGQMTQEQFNQLAQVASRLMPK